MPPGAAQSAVAARSTVPGRRIGIAAGGASAEATDGADRSQASPAAARPSRTRPRSQMAMSEATPAIASRRPERSKARALTIPNHSGKVRRGSNDRGSRRMIRRSSPPVASSEPSGLKARDQTIPSWAFARLWTTLRSGSDTAVRPPDEPPTIAMCRRSSTTNRPHPSGRSRCRVGPAPSRSRRVSRPLETPAPTRSRRPPSMKATDRIQSAVNTSRRRARPVATSQMKTTPPSSPVAMRPPSVSKAAALMPLRCPDRLRRSAPVSASRRWTVNSVAGLPLPEASSEPSGM